MGRPPKSREGHKSDRRTTSVSISLTETEMELIKRAADHEGMPLATWARQAFFEKTSKRK